MNSVKLRGVHKRASQSKTHIGLHVAMYSYDASENEWKCPPRL